MPIGQIPSNSVLVGTLVFDSKSINNTGISDRQIKPLNLAGQSNGSPFAPTEKPESSTLFSSSNTDMIEKIIKQSENQTDSSPLKSLSSDKPSLELSPAIQSYNFIGKLSSITSAAEKGTQLDLIA